MQLMTNVILKDIIKFQSTISSFCQQNPVPLISSCNNFHIVKLLFQNASIFIKFSNVLLISKCQNKLIINPDK